MGTKHFAYRRYILVAAGVTLLGTWADAANLKHLRKAPPHKTEEHLLSPGKRRLVSLPNSFTSKRFFVDSSAENLLKREVPKSDPGLLDKIPKSVKFGVPVLRDSITDLAIQSHRISSRTFFSAGLKDHKLTSFDDDLTTELEDVEHPEENPFFKNADHSQHHALHFRHTLMKLVKKSECHNVSSLQRDQHLKETFARDESLARKYFSFLLNQAIYQPKSKKYGIEKKYTEKTTDFYHNVQKNILSLKHAKYKDSRKTRVRECMIYTLPPRKKRH